MDATANSNSPPINPVLVRRAAWATGFLIFAGISVLVTDWVIAARQAPRDDQIVKALQLQVKEDSAIATKLEAEQKRITDAHRARRTRDHAIGWVLVMGSAIFLASTKRLIALKGCKPAEMKAAHSSPTRKARPARRRRSQEASSSLDLSFVDEAVAKHGTGKEAAIPLLQAIQQHYRYLPDEALRHLCDTTQITPAEIAGTSSFYGQFRRSPVGKHIVRVCHGTACHVAGARQIAEELRRHLEIPEGADTDAGRMFTLEEVACLGCCSLAPVLMVDEHTAGRLTTSTAAAALEEIEEKETA